MSRYLMETVLKTDKSLHHSFEATNSVEARERAYLRLSQKDVRGVNLWRQDGADWLWLDSWNKDVEGILSLNRQEIDAAFDSFLLEKLNASDSSNL